MEALTHAVTEIQGLYGSFVFPEKLLQKIWLRGDFNRAQLRAVDGRRVSVLHPGKWNLLGGPDFSGARLRFDEGPAIEGDVEAHLHLSDWDSHRHASDPAYDRVILHVVLFPPAAGQETRGAGGRLIPSVVLLPLLHHDLEEFAADEAVETLANRVVARIPEELGALTASELDQVLRTHAARRWAQKVHFASLRVQRLGWVEACHQTALDVLGYRFNRAPMLRVAGRWPLARWAAGVNLEEIVASEAGHWSVQGVRPANRPRHRLRQYATWVQQRPAWPDDVRAAGRHLPVIGNWSGRTTGEVRRALALSEVRRRMVEQITGDALGGTRFDTLMCDAVLPLLAAATPEWEGVGCWFHWYGGDLPPMMVTALRRLGVFDGRHWPASHGLAQGLLGWLLAREAKP